MESGQVDWQSRRNDVLFFVQAATLPLGKLADDGHDEDGNHAYDKDDKQRLHHRLL